MTERNQRGEDNEKTTFDGTFLSGIKAVLNGADPIATADAIKQHNATLKNDSSTLSLLSQIDEANAAQPTAEKENTMNTETKATAAAKPAKSSKAVKPATEKAAATPAKAAPVKPEKAAKAAKTPAAKKEEPAAPAALTRDTLIAAASDMNEKMGLKPAINVKINEKAIARDIMKNSADLDFSDFNGTKKAEEQITDATKATLELLGFVVPVNPESPKATKPAKKAKSTSELKADKAAKPAKVAAPPSYSRYMAITDVLLKIGKKGISFKDIQQKSDDLHVAKGGESNPKTGNITRSILHALISFGVLTVEKNAAGQKVYHRKEA